MSTAAAPEKIDTIGVLMEAFRRLGAHRILDLGCGSGALAARLAASGFAVTGIDPRAEAVEAARRRAPEARFVQASAEALPEDLGSFDAACMVNALHHVPPSAMETALTGALSLLPAEGALLVVEPLADGSFFRCMQPVDDETEIRALAIAAIEALVARGGAVLGAHRRWDRENRFDGLDGFLAYLLDVEPDRADAIARARPVLEHLWAREAVMRDGKAILVQPMLFWSLSPAH